MRRRSYQKRFDPCGKDGRHHKHHVNDHINEPQHHQHQLGFLHAPGIADQVNQLLKEPEYLHPLRQNEA